MFLWVDFADVTDQYNTVHKLALVWKGLGFKGLRFKVFICYSLLHFSSSSANALLSFFILTQEGSFWVQWNNREHVTIIGVISRPHCF